MGTSTGMINKARSYVGQNYKHFCDVAAGGACIQWCCAFIYTCAKETDNAGVMCQTNSCTAMMNWFKQNGIFMPRATGKPQPGDLQFYDYDSDKSEAEHIGVVVSVSGNRVTTIEGNMGNGGPSTTRVEQTSTTITDSQIIGWARPKYGSNTQNSNGVYGPPTLEEAGIDISAVGLLTEEDYGYVADFDLYTKLVDDEAKYSSNTFKQLKRMSHLRGIIGLPPQYMPSTDLRLGYEDRSMSTYFDENRMGTDYIHSIASRMPLVYLSPCEPAFLPRLTGSNRKDALSKYVKALANPSDSAALDSLLNDDYSGKLYSVQYAYEKYYRYVNPACRATAMFLKLEDSDLYADAMSSTGIKPYSYNWGYNYISEDEMTKGSNELLGADTNELSFPDAISQMQEFAYYKGAIPFYANTEVQVSREFSNHTTESQLSSSVNQLSDQARELQYILGLTSSQVGLNFDKLKEQLGSDMDSLTSFVDSLPIGGNLFSTLLGGINTMVAGGRIIFPQLWSDSESSETYTINIKLIAPDPDNFSIWLYIIVPLIHIWALVSPRQADYNGYNAPFLVKGFCKGLFNIDMGIITSCNINLGKENTWNKDGLPTVVEVSMSLMNLYNKLSMTDMTNMKYGLMNNIAEMDFLANLCGVNYNVPDTVRYAKMWVDLNVKNRALDVVQNIPIKASNWLDNKLLAISQAMQGI